MLTSIKIYSLTQLLDCICLYIYILLFTEQNDDVSPENYAQIFVERITELLWASSNSPTRDTCPPYLTLRDSSVRAFGVYSHPSKLSRSGSETGDVVRDDVIRDRFSHKHNVETWSVVPDNVWTKKEDLFTLTGNLKKKYEIWPKKWELKKEAFPLEL